MSKKLKIPKRISEQFKKTNVEHNQGMSSVDQQAKLYESYLKTKYNNAAVGFNMDSFEKFYVLTAYQSIYSRVANQIDFVIRAVDSVKHFYLTNVIVSQIVEDALSPKVNDTGIMKYSYPDPKIQAELNALQENINLDQLILNVTPDLIRYGEYTLETIISQEGNGIIDVTDSVDQGKVISLSQDGENKGFLYVDVHGTIQYKELADFVKFSLEGERIKIDFDNTLRERIEQNETLKLRFSKIPKFVRVGRSMLYPVLGKIKELELLEKLVPATKINKLSQGNLVSMPLPEGYDIEAGLEAVEKVENVLNRKVTVDSASQEITVEAILSVAGRTKIIPSFGEKGRLDKMDVSSDAIDDLFTNNKDLRDAILDSVGVPSELIYRSESTNKNEILKRYSKYLRKLKAVQRAIVEGAKQIGEIHLTNKKIDYDPKKLTVTMTNHIVEIDNLDRLEHADITISFLKNIRDFFNEMGEESSPYKDYIDFGFVAKHMGEQLKSIGLGGAFRKPPEPEAPGPLNDQPSGLNKFEIETGDDKAVDDLTDLSAFEDDLPSESEFEIDTEQPSDFEIDTSQDDQDAEFEIETGDKSFELDTNPEDEDTEFLLDTSRL